MSTDVDVLVQQRPEATKAPRSPRAAAHPVTVIRPSTGWKLISVSELWPYRNLILHFIWRDIKVRYKHTILGIGWAVLQPCMMMLVFASYFALMHTPKEGELPYPIFIYSGLVPWLFFASATPSAGSSIVHSEHLITKIYFPRLVVTVSTLGVYMVDFCIAFLLLIAMMFYFGRPPLWTWLLAPLVLAMFAVAALGVGINLAALNVTYRDFRLVVPFMMQLWFFATPIIFLPFDPAASAQPERPAIVQTEGGGSYSHETVNQLVEKTRSRHEAMLLYNPIYSLIITFRSAILGEPAVPWLNLGISMSIFVALLLIGSIYFHRVEDRFADII